MSLTVLEQNSDTPCRTETLWVDTSTVHTHINVLSAFEKNTYTLRSLINDFGRSSILKQSDVTARHSPV